MRDASSKTRTPTETLMEAMERFSEAEPKECLVIWPDENGDMCWSSSSDSIYVKLGMVEFMRTIFKKGISDNYGESTGEDE